MGDKPAKTLVTWLQLLRQNKVIAVIRSPRLEVGLALAEAVAAGGIKLIEITWNSHQPAELISKLSFILPNCTIGTGTILTPSAFLLAVEAGAKFAFSPSTNLALLAMAQTTGIPFIPGALTPTEIVTAWQQGASSIKVFPIKMMGGADYLKTLQSPLGHIPLIPTGGVTIDNAKQMLDAGAIAVGISSNLFPSKLVKNRNWQAIQARVEELLEKISH